VSLLAIARMYKTKVIPMLNEVVLSWRSARTVTFPCALFTKDPRKLRGWEDQTEENPYGCGFSCTVWTYEAEDLPFLDGETNVNYSLVLSIVLAQVLGFYHRQFHTFLTKGSIRSHHMLNSWSSISKKKLETESSCFSLNVQDDQKTSLL
jgi:hypothetical protein